MQRVATPYFIWCLILVACLCTGIFSAPLILHAQNTSSFTSADVNLKINPPTPHPGDTVTLTLESFIRNVNVATIVWSVNGSQRLAGIGKNTLVINAGAGGTSTDIVVTVTWDDGVTIVRRARLSPVDVDILWQATDSYVPAGYRGKALPTAEGEVRFVALPQTTTGGSLDEGYIYTWRRNGSVVQNASGFGRNSFLMKNNFFDTSFNVGVLVTSRTGDYQAERTLTLPRFNPQIIFQLDQFPLPQRLVGDGKSIVLPSTADGKTRLLTAIPLFFSVPNSLTDILFSWTYNGTALEAQFAGSPYERVLTSLDSVFSPGLLGVAVTSNTHLLQEASGTVRIQQQ